MSTDFGGELRGTEKKKKLELEKKKKSELEELYRKIWAECDPRKGPKIFRHNPALYETKEFRDYAETIRKSGGFTVPHLGDLEGLVRKDIYHCDYDAQGMKILTKLSQAALEKFNQDHDTNYKLEKVDRGNWKVCGSHFTFYITFVAARESSEEVKESVEIQAEILKRSQVPEVLECRLRQDMEALIQARLALEKNSQDHMEEKGDAIGSKRKLSTADLETEKKCKLGDGDGDGDGDEEDEEDEEDEDEDEEDECVEDEEEESEEEDDWEEE